jgi:hypothetical protein
VTDVPALPADDTPENVVEHLRAVLTRMGLVDGDASDDAADVVFQDRAVEIRLTAADKRITVKRLRGGAEVLAVDPEGRIEGEPHPDFARVSDHLAALAHECMAEDADDERATTPMLAEDVEDMIEDDEAKPDDGHRHVEFVPECHPESDLSVYYCEGTLHADCSACQRPHAAFQLARRSVGEPPAVKRHRRPQTQGFH